MHTSLIGRWIFREANGMHFYFASLSVFVKRPKVNTSFQLVCSLLSYGPSRILELTSLTGWLFPEQRGFRAFLHCWLLCGFRGLNSGPYACRTSTLPSELSSSDLLIHHHFISVVLGYLFLLHTFNYSYQILPNFWECFYGHLTHNTLHITSVSWLEYLVLRGDENSYIRPALMDYLCHDHLWQPPAVTHGPLLRIML